MRPKLIVYGAAGRMGKCILSLAIEAGEFDILAGVDKGNHPDMGKDLGVIAGAGQIGVVLGDKCPRGADVIIDFSLPDAADDTIEYCLGNNTALVLGTTGLSTKQHDKLKDASEQIPVLYSTNMSVGMNILFKTVGKLASMLQEDCDIEIIEQHHRFKKDAPSGSALRLAENICKETGRDYPGSLAHGRSGKDAARRKGTVGIHAVRAGDIAGIHSVIFGMLGETITLNHTAQSRDCFARGALRAAKWLIGKDPGLYSMADCLGL